MADNIDKTTEGGYSRSGRGSYVITVFTERPMRCLAVTEHELDTLEHSGREMAFFFSVAAAVFGYAAEWVIELESQSNPAAPNWIVACVIFGALFGVLGLWKQRHVRTLANAIKEGSTDVKSGEAPTQ